MTNRPDAGRTLWRVGLGLMLLGLVAPILVVPVPPLLDYPNHLARAYLLAFRAGDPVLRRMFAVHWAIIPNLAVDLVLPPLMHLMPPLLAGRLVVALTVLLPATGSIALSRAVFGRRSLWQLGVGFVAYDAIVLAGMLNFQISLGVALWGAAAWVVLSRRHVAASLAAGTAFALIAFVAHLFGFILYAVLVASLELAEVRNGRRPVWRLAAAALTLALATVLCLLAPVAGAGGPAVWQGVWRKLFLLLVPVLGYSVVAGVILALLLLGLPILWARSRRLVVAPFLRIAAPALFVAYWLLPYQARGGSWIDARVPVMLGFLLFAGLMPRRLEETQARVVTCGLALLFAVRMAAIAVIWHGSTRDLADIRHVIVGVSPGARVLVVDAARPDTTGRWPLYRSPLHILGRAYWHDGAFVLIDRDADWSDAFALRGQQPIAPLPPYDRSGDGGAEPPPPLRELDGPIAADPIPHPYLQDWPDRFDDVLVLGAEFMPDPGAVAPEHLHLLATRGTAALFAVRTGVTVSSSGSAR